MTKNSNLFTMTIHSLFLAKLPVAVATLWLLAGSLPAATISTFAGTGDRGGVIAVMKDWRPKRA